MTEQGLITMEAGKVLDQADKPLTPDALFNEVRSRWPNPELTGQHILSALGSLINSGRAVEINGAYGTPALAKKLKSDAEWRQAHAGKIISRQLFETYSAQERIDFLNKGGVIG
jgi:hypothetical protein